MAAPLPDKLLSFENANFAKSIGRLSAGNTKCTGFLVGDESKLDSLAIVLTNGHCIMDHWDMNSPHRIIQNQEISPDNWSITFNYFHDSLDQHVNFPIKKIIYATMKDLDLGVLELGITIGELNQLGIKPLRLAAQAKVIGSSISVVGAPLHSKDAKPYLRLAECSVTDYVDVIERHWFWRNHMQNECIGISKGSSGSPVLSDANEVLAIINTTSFNTNLSEVCYLGHPCSVTHTDGAKFDINKNYALQLNKVRHCFEEGQFNLQAPLCPLATEQHLLAKSTRNPVSNKNIDELKNWNIKLNSYDSDLRYKTGLSGKIDCYNSLGYLDSFAEYTEIKLPTTNGSYQLCIAKIDDETGDIKASPMIINTFVDNNGPTQEPIILLIPIKNKNSIEPIYSVPELSNFTYRYSTGTEVNCDGKGYRTYRRFPIAIEASYPITFCMRTYDTLGNQGSTWYFKLLGLSDDQEVTKIKPNIWQEN